MTSEATAMAEEIIVGSANLEAIRSFAAAVTAADHIRCYGYFVDNEFPIEVSPLS